MIVFATVVVEEAGVVVVVNEQTKGVKILESAGFSVIAGLDATHVCPSAENIVDGVVHWVVENTRDVVLVGTDVGRVTVEGFAHLEDSSRCAKFRPEVLGDLGNSVDADTVEAVGAHEILNPVLECLTNP